MLQDPRAAALKVTENSPRTAAELHEITAAGIHENTPYIFKMCNLDETPQHAVTFKAKAIFHSLNICQICGEVPVFHIFKGFITFLNIDTGMEAVFLIFLILL